MMMMWGLMSSDVRLTYNNNNGNCKAPILRLKALNKRSITHMMYSEMEALSIIKNTNKIQKS